MLDGDGWSTRDCAERRLHSGKIGKIFLTTPFSGVHADTSPTAASRPKTMPTVSIHLGFSRYPPSKPTKLEICRRNVVYVTLFIDDIQCLQCRIQRQSASAYDETPLDIGRQGPN